MVGSSLVFGLFMQPLEGLLARWSPRAGSQSAMQAELPWTLGGVSQLRSDPFAITSHRSRNLVSSYAASRETGAL